jgi:hypothetical protein
VFSIPSIIPPLDPDSTMAVGDSAYAENPQLGTLIPDHLRELQALAADDPSPRDNVDTSDQIDYS